MFIPVASTAIADAFSQALWKIMVPSGTVGEITSRFCGWVVHPTNGQVMLNLPDAITAPILNPGTTPLAQFLAPFVTGGQITMAEVTALHNKVVVAQGTVIAVADIIPAYFIGISLSTLPADWLLPPP